MGNRKQGHGRRGQATVEFALSAVLLMTIICGIFELSWVFYNYSYLNNALSKAARLAVTAARRSVTIPEIEREVTQAVGGMQIGTPRVTTYTVQYDRWGADATENPAPVPWPPQSGQWVKISAEIPYPAVTPLSTLIRIAACPTLAGECTLPVE